MTLLMWLFRHGSFWAVKFLAHVTSFAYQHQQPTGNEHYVSSQANIREVQLNSEHNWCQIFIRYNRNDRYRRWIQFACSSLVSKYSDLSIIILPTKALRFSESGLKPATLTWQPNVSPGGLRSHHIKASCRRVCLMLSICLLKLCKSKSSK